MSYCSNIYIAAVVGPLPPVDGSSARSGGVGPPVPARGKRQATAGNNGRIYLARGDGAYIRLIVAEALEFPNALAVDPVLARIYWSDNGNRPNIGYADLDGTRRKEIVNRNLMPIANPSSIAIDYFKRSRLVWVDKSLHEINAIYPDGQNHQRLVMTEEGECGIEQIAHKICILYR
jgi:low density lipoprotein receptor-related protein 5/6